MHNRPYHLRAEKAVWSIAPQGDITTLSKEELIVLVKELDRRFSQLWDKVIFERDHDLLDYSKLTKGKEMPSLNDVVKETNLRNDDRWWLRALRDRVEEECRKYEITPLFVGAFGSRAKGYATEKSDYDFHVIYLGPDSKYIKAIDYDLSEHLGKEVLPPQISFQLVETWGPYQSQPYGEMKFDHKSIEVQLNFIDYADYVKELRRNNIDFRISLSQRVMEFELSERFEIWEMLDRYARAHYDPAAIHHGGYSRAAGAALKVVGSAGHKRGELVDGLYRLFMSFAATDIESTRDLRENNTLTLDTLVKRYLKAVGDIGESDVLLMQSFLPKYLADPAFRFTNPTSDLVLHLTGLIGRLIPIVKSRFAIKPARSQFDQAVHDTYCLDLINEVNTKMVSLIRERHK